MKKKVLYGFAMALIAGASMGTLQSCKDDLSDFQHQYAYDQAGLLKRVAELETSVKACKENCAQEIEALKAAIKANAGDIANLDSELKNLAGKLADYVTYTELETKLTALENNCKNYTDQQVANAVAQITALSSQVSNLEGSVNDLSQKVTELNGTVSGLSSKVDANETAINAINAQLETYKTSIESIKTELGTLGTKVEGIEEEIGKINSQLTDLQGMIEEAFLAIEQNQEYMTMLRNELLAEIEDKFNELTGRMDNLITSIVLQATDSPVFGNFSLPLGIQSNLLFNWYGYNDIEEHQFPSALKEYNYNQTVAPVLTAKDLENLGLTGSAYANIPEAYFGDVNLGKLYLTVNPAGNFFNSDSFVLETSAGKAYPATLQNVKKSDYEMTFGYSRSENVKVEGNGFYEADVVVAEDDILKAMVEIQEGLKSSAKDALKDPSKRTAVNLLKAIYSQLNGMLPAYGVRYNWDGYSVVSNYGIAATTAKPLSYAFLYGEGTSKHLPTFGHISNLIEKIRQDGKLKFDLGSEINIGDVNLDLGNIEFTVPETEVSVDLEGAYIEIDGVKYPLILEDGIGDVEGLDQLTENIKTAIINALTQASDNANVEINKVLADVEKQIDDMMANLNSQINGQIDSILEDFSNQAQPYFNRVNKLVDLYNKVAGKVNNFLANPNHYLQVAMFYNMGDGNVGILSNSFKSPTVFNGTNGWIGLYASSYTAEILAPAYKKFVAVTNIYDENGKEVTTAAALKAINDSGKYLNEVMDGQTIRFGISASSLKPGYKYGVVYQGVDYSGRTSAQKFYIQVK